MGTIGFSQGVSPAKILVEPEKGKELPERDPFFGLIIGDLLEIYDLASQSWKMSGCLFDGDYAKSSEALRKSGIMQSGKIYEQRTWVRRTKGNASSLLPTLLSRDGKAGYRIPNGKRGISLVEYVEHFPTLLARDNRGPRKMKKGRGISLVEYVDRFPTLTALDSKESLAANPRKDATATRSTLLSQKVYRETFPTLTASMETMEDMEQARFPWGDRPNYQECKMWLTLVANDGRQVDPPSYWHKKTPYKHLGSEVNRAEGTKGRKLSALFAEYIMGYPPYYTDLEEPKPIPGFEKWLELAAVHGPWVQEWPGVSRTVDKQKHRGHRIRCLGNSLVPQIAQILFMRVKEILDAESK